MRWQALLDNIVDAVCVLDAEMRLTYANKAARNLLDAGEAVPGDDEVAGIAAIDVVVPADQLRAVEAFDELLSSPGGTLQEQLRMRWSDGSERWVEVTATNQLNVPDVGGVICSFRDLTARRQLAHQARLDPLTEVGNRVLLRNHLEEVLPAAIQDGRWLVVAFIDLDHFKVINDSLGHEVGDQVLANVARRLVTGTRPSDVVCRFGGDEFVIVMLDRGPADADRIADRLQSLVSAPLAIEGREIFITSSIGLAFAGSQTVDPDQLLRDADLAMYTAKEGGRATHVVFGPVLRSAMQRRLKLTDDIRQALDGGQLRAALQPVVTADGSVVVGHEALLRWKGPDGSLRSAGESLDDETLGPLIGEVDQWMMRRSVDLVSAWHHTGFPRHAISCNVSGRTLSHPGFLPTLEEILEVSGIAPDRLWLELTEETLVSGESAAADVLREARGLGVRLGLDDFGSGYSSMAYLRDHPVEIIKIDKRFVKGIETDRRDVAVCEAMVAMAHALDMRVVAEGVETEGQRRMVENLGVDFAQGFLFGRPSIDTPLHSAAESVLDLRPLGETSSQTRNKRETADSYRTDPWTSP